MRRQSTLGFDIVMVALSAVLVVGGHLLVWADDPERGLVDGNQLFSVWALPIYVGFLTAAYLLFLWWSRRRRSNGLPLGYRAALYGSALFLVALAADFVWRAVDDRPQAGPEGVLAPTRLLLFVGAMLMLSGPILSLADRLQQAEVRRSITSAAALAFAIAIGLMLSLATLLTGFAHPFAVVAGGPEPQASFQPTTDLYEISPLDGASRRVTQTAERWEVHPYISADGFRVLYAAGQIDDFRVFENDRTFATERRLVEGEAHQDAPLVRADGTISFTSELRQAEQPSPGTNGPAPAPGPGDQPAPVRTEGLGAWLLEVGKQPAEWRGVAGEGIEEWSPTGDAACGWTVANGTFDVAIWDASGGAMQIVGGGPSQEWSCTWSPDGSRVAFHSDRDGDFEIYSVARDGSDLRQLTDHPGIDQEPRWGPADLLAFASTRGGEFDIYLADADGSNVRNVTNDPALEDGFYGLAWSPDGASIIAASMGRPYSTSSVGDTRPLGVASLLLMTLLFSGALILAMRLAPYIAGVPTVIGLVNGLLSAVVGQELAFAAAPLAAGLAADAWLLLTPRWRWPARAVGAVVVSAVVIQAAYFAALAVVRGVGWGADLALGTLILGALLSAAMAVVAFLPGPMDSADTIAPT